eukprot:jgi/Botrbrau1/17763/Bobra.0127s0020.1
MDFFTRAAETVRQQADKAALQARGLAQQLSDQTKVIADQTKSLAEQASSGAAAAAEQASAKLRNLQIQESFNAGVNTLGSATTAAAEQATARLQNIKLPDSINTGVSTLNATLTNTLNRVAAPGGGPGGKDPEPTPEELAAYGITPDFRDFVRSLTYSTFRDFPEEDIVHVALKEPGKYLTPWQERHCLLVVKTLKEINELRYVLCPKRMSDEEFWKVYFTLSKRHLPDEAWDPDFVPNPAFASTAGAPGLPFNVAGLQKSLTQFGSTAKQWSSQKGASILSAAQAALPSISVSNAGFEEDDDGIGWRGGPLREATESGAVDGERVGADAAASGSNSDGELVQAPDSDTDPVLEAFLKDVETKSEAKTDGLDGTEGSVEDDFDQYLNALNDNSSDGEEGQGDGDDLDLEDYMNGLNDDEDEEAEEKDD